MSRVLILQEYIPEYRVPFFVALHRMASEVGVEIVVASGSPQGSQLARSDAGHVPFRIPLVQHEFRIFKRRLVIRRVREVLPGADLVILEQARRNVDAYRLLSFRRGGRTKFALWGHGRDYTNPTSAIDRFLWRWLTSRADWFFAYTSGGVASVDALGFPLDRTSLVQNSIDTTALRESVASVPQESINSFALRYDLRGKTALFIGALDRSKRLDFLRKASVAAHELDADFRLILAGDGELREDVERWALQDSWVTYLGAVGGGEKVIALASTQVLAMPGRVGLVAVDSFASANPIITTNWEWHAPEYEYLVHGRNSIVSANDISAYALSLVETLNNSTLLDLLRAGCSAASTQVTLSAMVENFLDGILSALMAPRKRR